MFAATFKNLMPRMRFQLTKPKIENPAFKLHYQVTVTLLLLGTLLVCARELLGEHIRCFGGAEETEKFGKWINNYCFNMATFTFKELYNDTLLEDKPLRSNKVNILKRYLPSFMSDHETGRAIPHPGVGPVISTDGQQFTPILHTFYQWVPFLLFIQAVFFYLPHYIWKKKEGGRIKALVDGLQYAAISSGEDDLTINKLNIPSKKTLDKKLNIIKKDILLRLRVNRTWSVWLAAMEITNLVHIILQIWIVNRFLSGTFMTLGIDIIDFKNWTTAKVTPLEPIFPKVTKCLYHTCGASGTIVNHDVMCVMALNVVHEKIFVAMWFWFFGLFIVSLAAVIWRVSSYFLFRHSARFSEVMFRKASSAKLEPKQVAKVVQGCTFGDWLFLYYLAKNMNAIAFPKLLKMVAEEISDHERVNKLGYKHKLGFEPMMAEKKYHDVIYTTKENGI